MKASFFPLLLVVMAAACNTLDGPDSFGSPRKERGDSTGTASVRMDTTRYLALVRYSPGYDWQRDSLWGATDYEIILYKESEPLLTMSSGSGLCSPDPDLIHIVDGHLITEKADAASTVVAIDGQEAFRFEGRELLKGIVIDGDDIYTLSSFRSGKGFSFRKNGSIILRKSDFELFGSLSDQSYGESGALYSDMGLLCFCYSGKTDGKMIYHSVRGDSDDTCPKAAGRKVRDMKVIDGDAVVSYAELGLYTSDDWKVFPKDGGGYLLGGNIDRGISVFAGTLDPDGEMSADKICAEEGTVYFNGSTSAAICQSDGQLTLWSGRKRLWVPEGRNMLICPTCAAWKGSSLCVAASGMDRDIVRIWEGGSCEDMNIHGYACALRYRISPAS